MTTFELRNVVAHATSTALGLLLAAGLLGLVALKTVVFSDVAPLLLVVVPFLLYGRRPPGAAPAPVPDALS